MSRLAEVVRGGINEIDCSCWHWELLEQIGETECFRCRLRAALRDDERSEADGLSDRSSDRAA